MPKGTPKCNHCGIGRDGNTVLAEPETFLGVWLKSDDAKRIIREGSTVLCRNRIDGFKVCSYFRPDWVGTYYHKDTVFLKLK